jgi:ComF family protein
MLEQPKIIGEAPSPRALVRESDRASDRESIGESARVSDRESVGESARASARASAPAFSRSSAYAGERTSWLSRLWNHLPQDCLLCAGPARGQPVCVGCLGDVPVLPAVRCRVCALPLGALPGTAANLHVPEPLMGAAAIAHSPERLPSAAANAPARNELTCGRCQSHQPHYDATYAVTTYAPPADAMVQQLKYGHRLAMAGVMAQLMAPSMSPSNEFVEAVDIIIPMPISSTRLAERGFNQSLQLAKPLAKALGIRLDANCATRVRDTVPQASLAWKDRARNVRGAFAVSAAVAGLRVAVVDDVMTTGSTLDELAHTLKKAGATRVSNWVFARALP